jgi:hypothetical protein
MNVFKVKSYLLLASLITMSAFAQVEKGKISIGGSSIFGVSAYKNHTKTDDYEYTNEKTTSITLNPQIGFFVANGLSIGFNVSSGINIYDEDSYKTTAISFGLGPFVKYYYGTYKVKPMLAASFGGTFTHEKIKSTSEKANIGSLNASIGGGLGIFPNEKVALDIIMGFMYDNQKQLNDNEDNFHYITSGFRTMVTVSVIL